jgi:dipeptidyl aminopeptidase/acylaminoacyl peptidase
MYNGGNKTNITNNPADDEEPVWSPDGSKILFTSPRSGSWQLYTMGPTGANLSQLTATDHTGARRVVAGRRVHRLHPSPGSGKPVQRLDHDGFRRR